MSGDSPETPDSESAPAGGCLDAILESAMRVPELVVIGRGYAAVHGLHSLMALAETAEEEEMMQEEEHFEDKEDEKGEGSEQRTQQSKAQLHSGRVLEPPTPLRQVAVVAKAPAVVAKALPAVPAAPVRAALVQATAAMAAAPPPRASTRSRGVVHALPVGVAGGRR